MNNNIIPFQKIEEFDIFNYCKDLMLVYGANVNISRVTPHIVDGLKPVHKRILFSMFYFEKITNKTPRSKVSAIVGTTLGKLHPHGDAPIEGALISLGQPWNNNLPLIDSKGNFGNVSGDEHAAGRYIEARLTDYAWDCFFSEWNDKITDYLKSYDYRNMEPEYLPSKYPNILINGILGLGYGLYTGIPSYNFNEVMDLTIELIKNPKKKDVYLIPDSPTSCHIIDEGKFKSICETGSGSFKMRAIIDVTELGNLHIKALPYTVFGDKIEEKIIEVVKANKLDGIKDIISNSDTTNVNIIIEIKKGFDPNLIREELFRMTRLQESYNVNMKAIYDYREDSYSLKRLILDWIDLRRETKKRVYSYEYSKLNRRIHILEALIKLVNSNKFEDTVKLFRKLSNRSEIIKILIKDFNLTDLQAENISDMKMYQLSKDNVHDWEVEIKDLKIQSDKIENILLDNEKIDSIIIDELKEGKKKHGCLRRSKVIKIDNDEYIPDINYTIIFTKNGYFKKIETSLFNGIGYINKGDYPIANIDINNRETIIIFDDKGKAFTVNVKDLPITDIRSGGYDIKKYYDCSKIVSIIRKYEDETLINIKEPLYLVFITEDGSIKKSLYKNYTSNFKGLIGIKLKKDKLVDVKLIKGNRDILIYTKNGFGLRYNISEIPESLRMSSGITGIKLDDKDKVLGMEILDEEAKYLLFVTDKGNGKKCLSYTLESAKRADKNYRLISLSNDEELSFVRTLTSNNKEIEYQTSSERAMINVEEIPELTRMSKGKKIIQINKGEHLIGLVV